MSELSSKIKEFWDELATIISVPLISYAVSEFYGKVDILANSKWFQEFSNCIYSYFGCSIEIYFINFFIFSSAVVCLAYSIGNKIDGWLDKIAKKTRWIFILIWLLVISLPIGAMTPQILLVLAEASCGK